MDAMAGFLQAALKRRSLADGLINGGEWLNRVVDIGVGGRTGESRSCFRCFKSDYGSHGLSSCFAPELAQLPHPTNAAHRFQAGNPGSQR